MDLLARAATVGISPEALTRTRDPLEAEILTRAVMAGERRLQAAHQYTEALLAGGGG